MDGIELKDLVGGALQEKFSKAFERVIENLQDQNTSFKVKEVSQLSCPLFRMKRGMMCQ